MLLRVDGTGQIFDGDLFAAVGGGFLAGDAVGG